MDSKVAGVDSQADAFISHSLTRNSVLLCCYSKYLHAAWYRRCMYHPVTACMPKAITFRKQDAPRGMSVPDGNNAPVATDKS